MSMYGRDDISWDQLTAAGEAFLIERARLARVTSYTELNATLVRRTGLPGFDFDRQDERAAMGHLLGLIVARNRPATKLMISSLVTYLDANDAGPGFYALAQQRRRLPPRCGRRRRGIAGAPAVRPPGRPRASRPESARHEYRRAGQRRVAATA